MGTAGAYQHMGINKWKFKKTHSKCILKIPTQDQVNITFPILNPPQ